MMRRVQTGEVSPSRRSLLRLGATGALGAGLSAMSGGNVNAAVTATPSETEGPYWIDELLNRKDVRSDPATGVMQTGFLTRLTVNVSKLASGKSTPLSGAFVDIWHCNALGAYSDENAGMGNPNTKGQKFLRGYQVTNGHGIVQFVTIYPGWYGGRTAHIHARVRTFSGSTTTLNFTTQFFFSESITNTVYATAPYNTRPNRDTTNVSDNVYNTVSSGSTSTNPDGKRLMLRISDNGKLVLASFNIVIA
jgi:protocatechuate 3,4-dioxygenase beta subunit